MLLLYKLENFEKYDFWIDHINIIGHNFVIAL